jgi:hypothetical protein
MPHKHTVAEKEFILQRYISNYYDLKKTADECHVHPSTIRMWLRHQDVDATELETLAKHFKMRDEAFMSGKPFPEQPPTPENDVLARLRTIREKLVIEAERIAASLGDALDELPPRQRVVLLTQLLDRLIRLNTHLPISPVKYVDWPPIIRTYDFEYEPSDWAEEDPLPGFVHRPDRDDLFTDSEYLDP